MVRTGCISLLAISMIFSQAGGVSAKGNASTDTQPQEQTESYIAVTEDVGSYQKLEKIADERSILADEQPQALEGNQMMLLELTAEEAAELGAMDGIIAVEENALITANEEVPVDNELAEELAEQSAQLDFSQWNLEAVDWQGTLAYTGKGVNVAVLDSGISYTQGLDVAGRKDFVSPEAEISPLYDDASGHGTSIAGIIAADKDEGELQGVAEDANLYSVRVLDVNNEAPVSRVVEGIYWCISNGIDVINMSFGTTEYSTALEKAVCDAEAAGIIMVAAAGNHGDTAGIIDYPAAFDGVIAVGASTGENRMADFTSNGAGIDVLAPGEKVWSYNVLQGLMAVDGTSIATAHVTGAVAALSEKKPDMGAEFAKQLLTASSVQSADQEGIGILDIGNAVEMQDGFQVQEREVLPRTDVELEEYDTSGIVSGSWSKADHAATVTAVMSSTASKIVAGMAQYADEYYPTKVENSDQLKCGQFHGQHNYVANLHFLYKAACKMDDSDNTCNVSTVAGISDFMRGISAEHTKDKHYGLTDFYNMREIIVDAFTNAKAGLNNQTMVTNLGVSDKKGRSYMILGLAVHLLGDTFAHRTMVPKGDTSRFTQSDFTNWSNFKNRLDQFVIECRDIKSYTIKKMNSKYEDNTSFYPNRYNTTQKAVGNLIKLYQADDAFSLSAIIKDFGFQRKLNNFQAYADSAGCDVDVSEYSTDKFCVDKVADKVDDNEADYEDYTYKIYVP